jgi:hypothetical protein
MQEQGKGGFAPLDPPPGAEPLDLITFFKFEKGLPPSRDMARGQALFKLKSTGIQGPSALGGGQGGKAPLPFSA